MFLRSRSTSLRELIRRIEALTGRPCEYSLDDWRQGDQKYYVTDTRAFRELTGWQPQVGIEAGLQQLHQWLTGAEHRAQSDTPVVQQKQGALSHANVR